MQDEAPKETPREITVIRAGALGDVVLALPAVAALRAAAPGARLRAVGYPATWAVAGNLIDEVWSIDGAAMAGLLAGLPTPALRRAFGRTELVVAWTSHDPGATLRAVGVKRVVHAPPQPPPGVHAARLLLESLRDVPAVPPDLATWRISYDVTELAAGQALLTELGLREAVLLHPGAGAAWKRWPAARFAAVAGSLRRAGLPVALLGGPADEEALAAVRAHATEELPVLPPLEARALGALLAGAPCYLGNDSGPTHLAAASGAPTVALFGPSDPAMWGPLGRAVVLRRCTARSRESGGIRVCDDPACLAAITVEEVVRAVRDLIVQNRVENRS